MADFLTKLTEVNNAINSFVWVKIGLVLLLGTGILMTVMTKFFQISHLGHWWKKTIVGVIQKDTHNQTGKGSV
ncbi:MAG: sodium:alanine symporter family protein, partial [Lachnospiraceae bacterium]|nr:sodium:alanine symporter family protein [Lachnospiraceae bacterium]